MSSDKVPLITLTPITDPHHRWVGLSMDAAPVAADCSGATALTRLFGEFGLLESLGNMPCVVPLALTADLGNDSAALLPAEQIIFRVPPERCLDEVMLGEFTQHGFRVMAELGPATPASLPNSFTACAVDCSAPPDAAVLSRLKQLRGPHLALHADDPKVFSQCADWGLGWIVGNSALVTRQEKSAATQPGRAVMLKLLAQIAGDADSHDIEKTLKQDPQLSYQLLKLVNSVAFSLTTPIGNFNQAISLLGRRQLQRWLQLLLYARPSGDKSPGNPLMPRAALCAGAMENIAKSLGENREIQDQAFMVGMFSLLEPLFGQPVGEIIAPLNLPAAVNGALVARIGNLGLWLSVLEVARSGPGSELAEILTKAAISPVMWLQIQATAAHWAVQISREA